MAGVPAGRLSIEIVAEIARLQQDLDKAKRAVGAASRDISASANAANDNLANMGRTMAGVGTRSRAMGANMVNLSRQMTDVAQGFALGQAPMQIFLQQGFQVTEVLAMMRAEAAATNTSLTRMATQGLGRVAPVATRLVAVLGVGAIGMRGFTAEINRNSEVTVGWGDVVLGTFDAVAAAVDNVLGDAWRKLQIDFGTALDQIASNTARELNGIIGFFVAAANQAVVAWNSLPAVFAEIFVNVANAAIQFIEDMINGGISLINQFSDAVDAILGTNIGTISDVDIPGIENSWRGAGNAAGAAMAEASANAYRNYLGDFAEFVSPFAEARARDRLTEGAEEAGTAAGRSLGRAAAAEVTREIEDALQALKDAAIAEAERLENIANKEAAALANIERKNQAELDAARVLADEERRLAEDRITEVANLYETLFTDGVDGVWDTFKKQGLAAVSQIASQWTLALLSGQTAGGGGNPMQAVSSIFGGAANDNGLSTILGQTLGGGGAGAVAKGASLGGSGAASIATQLAAVPGLGQAIAVVAVTHAIGEGIEKLTGMRFDALAGVFGLLPGFAVGALKGAVKGVATIGSDGGSIGMTDSFGKKKYRQQAEGEAGGIIDTLNQLADALGVDLGTGAVSIGTRNGKYRVDPTGKGLTKTGAGAIDFGSDSEAAITFAIRNLIEDGVLTGISQASANILKAGDDLEAAIEKAILIESIPKLLKERLDPLGYALDNIDTQFQKVADALREGGATAQQFADAEKLYRLEREDAIAQFGVASQTLRDFLQGLSFGSNSPLSIRSQLASAEADFAGYEATIRAGGTVDQDKFTASAQALLGLSRSANASGSGYFDTFNRVQALTQQAITNVDTGTVAPGEGSVVFQQQTASNTQSIARMMEDQNALLRSIDAKLANDNTVTGNTFIGAGRGFAA